MTRLNPPLPLFTDPLFKVVTEGILLDQQILNTFYFFLANPTGALPDNSDLSVSFWSRVKSDWLNAVGIAFSMVRISTYRLDLPAMIAGVYVPTIPADKFGTIDEPPDTSFLAIGIRRYTGIRSQRGRGAVRIAGVVTTALVNNSFSVQQGARNDALANSFSSNVQSSANPGVIFHPCLATTTLPPQLLNVRAAPTVFWEAQTVPSTQRSRRPRSGGV